MSSSTISPPPRDFRHRDRRVSFDIGNTVKAPSFFSQLAAASLSTMPGSSNNNTSRTGYHSRQRSDRRARVDDAMDGDGDGDSDGDDDTSNARRHAGRAASRSRAARAAAAADSAPPPPVQAPAQAGQPGQPSITASAAAAGYNGLDPAVSANPVFTHVDNGMAGAAGGPFGGLPGIPIVQPGGYNIQAFPTFMPSAMPPGFAAYAMGGAGSDSTGMTGISFLPAVPDTTNGPMLHTYIPRSDAPGQAGAAYMPPGYTSVSPLYSQHCPVRHPAAYPSAPYYYAGVPMAGVPIAATTSPLVPIATQAGVAYVQQHPQQHPAVAYAVGGGGMGGSGGPPMVMMPGMGMPGPGGNYAVGGMCGMGGMGGMGSIHPEPALGVGQTPNEVMQEQLEFAYNNNMYEPQDFKPADDDKSRFYWVREMDGNWTQRSRATIDHIGCRWYITDSGVFYAVRLPN